MATVSRVLNAHPAVTDETRSRVLEAIATLDYEPNRAARALSRRRTGAVAAAVPFFTHPSTVERLRGVLAALDDSPYELVLFGIAHAEHRRARLGRLLRGDVADGLLLVSLRPESEDLRRFQVSSLPLVVIDAECTGVPSVVVDDVAGGRLAARHLIDLGHRRIGFVGDEVDPLFQFTSSSRRLQGLAAELADAGGELDRALVREGRHGQDHAHRMALELLRRPDRPTAIFAHADTQAFGVLEAAADLGLRVPEDLSVIGFDDIEAARFAGLTTVRQPLFESGRLGTQLLLDALARRPRGADRVELPLELVVRRTTGPAPSVRQQRGRRRTA